MREDGGGVKPFFRIWHHQLGVMNQEDITKELWDEIQSDAGLRPVSGRRAMEILCDPVGNLFILDTCGMAHCVNQSRWVAIALDEEWAKQ